MITIALDEQGDFENIEGKLCAEPVFIGGIIYDDNEDSNDYETEKKRLHKYLENVCASVSASYPRDLHYMTNGTFNNGRQVKDVKTKLGETLKEFFEQGTWNGNDMGFPLRVGKYYIFATVRGENGKDNLLNKDISEMVREDFASNLYLHMAEDVVERIIFHNPIIENIKKIRLELATRRVILEGENRISRMKEYEKLGYVNEKRPSEPGAPKRTEYLLTNPANYRTAIEREMLDSGKDKVMIDRIGVKSIYYKQPKKGMDFLYLADAICANLSFHKTGSEPKEWIESFDCIAREINGNGSNMIWSYDEVDDYFSKAWKHVENKDYYEALSLEFNGMQCESSVTEFYTKKWFPLIQRKMNNDKDVESLTKAVWKFKDSTMWNNLNQEKLVYIYEALEKLGEQVPFSNKKDEAKLYHLYDAGVSVYTHIGDSEKAKQCFEKTRQYAEYVETEVYLRTRNKMVVFLCDTLEFDEALELADENVRYHELLSKMKKEIFESETYESLNHAIAISQRGQVYAFMRDVRAEGDFLKALQIMDAGTPDRLITESYLLHYYIDVGEQQKYEELVGEYFDGDKTVLQQFDYLVKEGMKGHNSRFSLKFALYVYIKALYVFYIDEISVELLSRLVDIEVTLEKLDEDVVKQMSGHPWELIYKYLALICYRYGKEAAGQNYVRRLELSVDKSEGIIKSIAENSLHECKQRNDNTIETETFTYMYV